jgi:hypothetical protein
MGVSDDSPPHFYLTSVATQPCITSDDSAVSDPYPPNTTFVKTETIDASGSGPPYNCDETFDYGALGTIPEGWSGYACPDCPDTGGVLLNPGGSDTSWSGSGAQLGCTLVLSNEYTTAQLKTDTVAAYPDLTLVDGPCQATASLSSDETSYSIEKFVPRFTNFSFESPVHPVPASQDYVISYNETFVPDVGGTVHTARTLDFPSGQTYVSGMQVDEPSSNGTITITDITFDIP